MPATTTPRRWSAWHLHLGTTARGAHDRVLTDVIGPTVRELAPGTEWFFIRYWQSGPHLRLRVADLTPAAHARLEEDLRDRLAVAGRLQPGEEPLEPRAYRDGAARLAAAGETGANATVRDLLPPGVHRAVYEPEYERYGGPALMPAAESLFHLSSELVLGLVPSTADESRRSRLALRGTLSAAVALGDPAERAPYFARGLDAWRAWASDAGHPAALVDRVTHVEQDPATVRVTPGAHGPFADWHAALAAHAADVRRATPLHPGMLLFSHVHMLHNRLGLSLLEELRTYAWLSHLFPATAPAPDLAPAG
ncbi:thiopeptide-type bacteriocin biosynthesis protein [Streptomyces sp. AC627_RSS907]|uniref:thiopeptide-type bacteriocin biosynthesis protein n=1 Tax=Streptomyces sp. AC627_RSS907 TaxID=2823684 RepID=UPI001C21C83B|nr:thiopeptide-type bacteriocin biosynthesis protein [Streptomyces sp. AC627_RSS907]